jgi:hypothetical protein
MKLLTIVLIIGIGVIVVLLIKAQQKQKFKQSDLDDKNSKDALPPKLMPNDRLISIKAVNKAAVDTVLKRMCVEYNINTNTFLPRLFTLNENEHILCFPYGISFFDFCQAINYLNYPFDFNWSPIVRGWTTPIVGDEWITPKSTNIANIRTMLFVPADDDEYDVIYGINLNNIAFKTGFSISSKLVIQEHPKEAYKEPPYKPAGLEGRPFIDFV